MITNKPEVVLPDEVVSEACRVFLGNLADHQKHYEIDVHAMRLAIGSAISMLGGTATPYAADTIMHLKGYVGLCKMTGHDSLIPLIAGHIECIERTLTRPAGGDFVMVPKEPTGDMLDAMIAPWLRGAGTERECLTAGWKGALSAAPQQHGLEVGGDGVWTRSMVDDFKRRGAALHDRISSAQQPAEAVYLIKDDFGLRKEQTKAEHDWWDGKQNAPARRVLYTAPSPAIDIGMLRELGKRVETLAYRQHRDGGMGPLGADLLNIANGIAALIGGGGER